MDGLPISPDRVVHSDFLIHWTGKDIETREWWKHPKGWSETTNEEDEAYLKRLSDILRYGLWMTCEGDDRLATIRSREVQIPRTPRCCFTELRLSESRRHAIRYGRLGIGFKRPFLIQRFGRPLAYFGFGGDTNDRLLDACSSELSDKRLLNFFKPMNSDPNRLVYDLYSESEWRMLMFEELLEQQPPKMLDPRNPTNVEHHAYYNTLSSVQQDKLQYLVPLDGWFAMIIYPSLSVKNRAQWDRGHNGVFDLVTRLKADRQDHGNRVEGFSQHRSPAGNWPIEVNLDACSHF